MLDRPAEVCLPKKALEEAGGLQEVGVDHLERYGTAGLQAGDRTGHLGPIDLAHTASTEFGEDLVGSKSAAYHSLTRSSDPPLEDGDGSLSTVSRCSASIDTRSPNQRAAVSNG